MLRTALLLCATSAGAWRLTPHATAGVTRGCAYPHIPHRRGCGLRMSVASEATAEATAADPSRWAVCRDAEGVPALRPANAEFQEEVLTVVIQRTPQRSGLGLGLVEHAATADGSAALCLVSEVAPDSNAALSASAPLQPGDALVAVGMPGENARGGAARVEGLTYDATVAAIGAVPAGPIELVVKRLSVRPAYMCVCIVYVCMQNLLACMSVCVCMPVRPEYLYPGKGEGGRHRQGTQETRGASPRTSGRMRGTCRPLLLCRGFGCMHCAPPCSFGALYIFAEFSLFRCAPRRG